MITPENPIFRGRCTKRNEELKKCITLERLKRLAASLQIPGRSGMNKEQLVVAITNQSDMTLDRLFENSNPVSTMRRTRSTTASTRRRSTAPTRSVETRRGRRTTAPRVSNVPSTRSMERATPLVPVRTNFERDQNRSYRMGSNSRPISRREEVGTSSIPPVPVSMRRRVSPRRMVSRTEANNSPNRIQSTGSRNPWFGGLLSRAFSALVGRRRRPTGHWYERVRTQPLPANMNQENRFDPVSMNEMARGIRLGCGHWVSRETFLRIAPGLVIRETRLTPQCPLCRREIRRANFDVSSR